ncbi:MAG: Holliday junction branch migration protein RuvA [Eubacteriales bacterium]|nr:Holliday junction branch migration protein RuvA [Eubacteriales bacterium]
MYSYIKGILAEIEEGKAIVEAGGVGYEIFVPATVLRELPPDGSEVKLFTHFVVKEDEESLYGFLTKDDKSMFESLIGVNGIGPKGALGILSTLSANDLRMAIVTGDAKSISAAPGIGKKTAERVILDLKDKIGSIADAGGISISQVSQGVVRSSGPVAEAIDALTMLGYSRTEAGRAVGAVNFTEDMTTEDVLKLALKNIRL